MVKDSKKEKKDSDNEMDDVKVVPNDNSDMHMERDNAKNYSHDEYVNDSTINLHDEDFISRVSSAVSKYWHKLPRAVRNPPNYAKIIIIGTTAASNGYLNGEIAAVHIH